MGEWEEMEDKVGGGVYRAEEIERTALAVRGEAVVFDHDSKEY